MNLITKYLTDNPCFKANRSITVKGLMLHSVGCPQPNPMVFVRNWNKASYSSACVHGFIGEEDVYITLPCLETAGKAHRGWHGGGSSNNTHIGVEMCEPSTIKYTGGSNFTCTDKAAAVDFVKKATQNAVELFAQLCVFHNLDPQKDGVIVSHAEGYKRGIATNHGDPEHLWKQLEMDYNMDKFRADVAYAMGNVKAQDSASKPPYQVKVNTNVLNIRKGPSTGSSIVGQIKNRGVYTIVAESDGAGASKWGKLKSGAGWISLDYVKEV